MNAPSGWCVLVLASGIALAAFASEAAGLQSPRTNLEFVVVSQDARQFELAESKLKFRPWGFNYDHDATNRLLETYWQAEWDAVVGDFEEMKQLGANTVRIHLQVSRFMNSPRETNRESLEQLSRLLLLAEQNGLYLDITGLGCYDKQDVPGWYSQLNELQRWKVQGRFWEAVAQIGSNRPAVFCYDLMNEPLLTEDKRRRDWTPTAFDDRYFVQRLSVDFAGRSAKQIASAWVNQMVAAIRKHDRRHLITVGAIPWAMTWPEAQPIIYSPEVGRPLDFVSVHFYPKRGEVAQALKALAVYDVGKPIVIEEMFPLNCSVAELDHFIDGSESLATGWLGFYWGKSIAEYKQAKSGIADAMAQEWLEYFVRKTPEILGGKSLGR